MSKKLFIGWAAAATTAAMASSLLFAAGAEAKSPCTPVRGVSPCLYQVQVGQSIDEPLRAGDVVRLQSIDPVNLAVGSLGSISCPQVTLGGTVGTIAPAGLLSLSLTSSSFGLENDECGSSLGPVFVGIHGPQKWINVLNLGNDKSSLGEDTEEGKMIIIVVTWKRLEGGNELSCTYRTGRIGGEFNANGQAIELTNGARTFSLEKSTSGPSCPRSASLGSSSWALTAQTPAGGLAPVVVTLP